MVWFFFKETNKTEIANQSCTPIRVFDKYTFERQNLAWHAHRLVQYAKLIIVCLCERFIVCQ